jgi:O-antigen/teichoic acid export membrane protein
MIEKLANLGRRSLFYSVGNGVNKLVAIIALPFLTGYLSPPEFAIIVTLTVMGVVYRSLFGLGVGASTGIVYYQQDDVRRRQDTIGTAILIQLCSAVVMVVAVIALSNHIGEIVFLGRGYDLLIFLYTISVSLQLIAQPYLLELQYRDRVSTYVGLTSAGAVVGIVATLILVVWAGHGVRGWVEGDLLGSIVTFAGLAILNRHTLAIRFVSDVARSLLSLGLPLIPSAVFLFIIQYSGTYMLQWFVDRGEVGIYGIGYNLGMAFGLATAGFSSAWFPFFQSYTGKKESARVFSGVLHSYVFIFGLVCFLFFVFAKPVVHLLTDERYHEAYKVVGMAAVGQFCFGLWSILLPGMYFAKEIYYVSVIQGISAGIVIISNLILIPRFGIQGAAMAFSGGCMAMVILQGFLNWVRNYQIFDDESRRVKYLVVMLVVITVLQIAASANLPMWGGIVVGLTTISAYVWVGWSLLSGQERAEITNWVPVWNRSQAPR